MKVRNELTESHVYRLHQLDRPVVVEVRTATVSEAGLNRLVEAAQLLPRHVFTLVIRSSATCVTEERKAILSQLQKQPNVLIHVLDEQACKGWIIAERERQHDRLAERAAAAIAKVGHREKAT